MNNTLSNSNKKGSPRISLVLVFSIACALGILWLIAHIFFGPGMYFECVSLSQTEPSMLQTIRCTMIEMFPWVLLFSTIILCSWARKISAWFTFLLCVACIFLFFLLNPFFKTSYIFCLLQNPYNNSVFDSVTWVEHSKSQESFNPRGLMVKDLLQNHLHVGMTQQEVELILGKSEWSRSISESKNMNYVIGVYSGILDYDYLRIYLDKQGKVFRVKVIQG